MLAMKPDLGAWIAPRQEFASVVFLLSAKGVVQGSYRGAWKDHRSNAKGQGVGEPGLDSRHWYHSCRVQL